MFKNGQIKYLSSLSPPYLNMQIAYVKFAQHFRQSCEIILISITEIIQQKNKMDIDKDIKEFEVIVVGAGPAGIGAASILKKENVPHVILQARNRVGGRTLTQMIDGVPVDLGACWIHSYSKQNPLKKYVSSLKVNQTILTKRSKGRIFMDGEQGGQFNDDVLEVGCINSSFYSKLAQQKAGKSDKDMSIYEAGRDYMENNINKFKPSQKRCTQLIINMAEHYQASSIKEMSANHYEFRIDDGGDFMPECGYGQMLRKIVETQQLNIHFEKVVQNVIYDQQKVIVQCKDKTIYTAKKIICSFPLGTLKANKVNFKPELPQNYQQSILRLGAALMNKVIVSFEQNFWGPVSWVSIGCDERGKFSQIYNLSQKNKHILCCFITDDFARKCQKLPNQTILNDFIDLLKKTFKTENIKVREWAVTKWGQEEFSLSSYSSFHVGSSPEDCYLLRKPIDNKVWLVGEHCYAEHIGTAHGAFKTGQWAAEQVLKSLKWINPILKQPLKIIPKENKNKA